MEEEEETAADRRFIESLEVDYVLHRMPGDGNCLFHAISRGLSESQQIPHRQVRCSVVQYILANFDSFKGAITGNSDVQKKRKVKKMMELGKWGGALETRAAAEVYQYNIVVFSANLPVQRYPDPPIFQKTIYLSYHRGSHYNFLSLKRDREVGRGVACTKCTRTFSSNYLLEKHMEQLHSAERKYDCAICGASFLTKTTRNTHIYQKHPKDPNVLKCPVCGKTCSSINSKYDHMKTHDQGPHTCETCQKTYTTKSGLQRHVVRMHGPEQVHQCPKCDKSFQTKGALGQHIRGVHSGIKFPCQKCGKQFSSAARRSKHLQLSHGDKTAFPCPKCPKTFSCKLRLTQHDHRMHKRGKFTCDKCGKDFPNKKSMTEHRRKVHSIDRIKCQLCGAFFKNKDNLRNHTTAVHSGRHYPCEFCGRRFKKAKDLQCHQQYFHSTNRPYKCDICGESYKRYNYLKIHQSKLHDHQRDYLCEICGVALATNYNHAYHMKVKHGQDSLVKTDEDTSLCSWDCLLCKENIRFPTSASLQFHRMIRHPDKLAPGDAKNLIDIWTGGNNRIYLNDEEDCKKYVELQGSGCKDCNVQFFTPSSHLKHVLFHHSTATMKIKALYGLSREIFSEVTPMKKKRSLFKELYQQSLEAFPVCEKRHHLYHLVFVPATETKETLLEYLSNKDNLYYYYSGIIAMANNNSFVSSHHLYGGSNNACTNLFAKITSTGEVPFRAFLISEDYVESYGDLTGNKANKRKEALKTFTVFLYAKFWKREDVYFQQLQLEEVRKHLTLPILIDIINQVESCDGVLFNIPGFQVEFAKEINICTDKVSNEDIAFSRCDNCDAKFVSRYHSRRHALQCDNVTTLSVMDQLIELEELDPDEILEILGEERTLKHYVYLAAGVNKKLSFMEVSYHLLTNNTEAYAGKSTNHVISPYHFSKGDRSSLQQIAIDNEFVFHLWSWRFTSERDMCRAETALIVIGKLRRSMKKRPRKMSLVNTFLELYDVSELFTLSEWMKLFEIAVSPDLSCFEDLPSFLSYSSRQNLVNDITARIFRD